MHNKIIPGVSRVSHKHPLLILGSWGADCQAPLCVWPAPVRTQSRQKVQRRGGGSPALSLKECVQCWGEEELYGPYALKNSPSLSLLATQMAQSRLSWSF